MGLHNIRAEFYLDTKKKEMDFKENILKGLALELDKKVNQAKQQLDLRFKAVEERITQEADTTKSSIEALEQLMNSKFDKMEKEQKQNRDEINSRIVRHKDNATRTRKSFEERLKRAEDQI